MEAKLGHLTVLNTMIYKNAFVKFKVICYIYVLTIKISIF